MSSLTESVVTERKKSSVADVLGETQVITQSL